MGKPAKQVVNMTRKQVVASDLRLADNPFTRLCGLMGQPGLPPGRGLWIVPCNQIHSCFMRFEFDAIFVDKTGKVLHLEERMRPWRLSRMVKGGRAVLELDGGVIAQTGTQVGDTLEIRPVP